MEHFWCQDKPWANSDSQDSSRPKLGRIHHLPFYCIFCASSQDPHPNGILSLDSQVGVPKFSQLGLLRLWGPIILRADLQLSLKQSCSPHRELSNGMLHATCTWGNWSDSRLLMVENQIGNLTPGLSFGHNLCFKCPNGSCEPILDIYVPKIIQWYKELFNPLGFDPWNHFLKFENPSGLQLPKWELPWECEFIPSHFLTFPGAWNVTPGFLLARPPASPCFGRKPKVRVPTSQSSSTPLYLRNATNQGAYPNSLSFHCFHIWIHSWVYQGGWGCITFLNSTINFYCHPTTCIKLIN